MRFGKNGIASYALCADLGNTLLLCFDPPSLLRVRLPSADPPRCANASYYSVFVADHLLARPPRHHRDDALRPDVLPLYCSANSVIIAESLFRLFGPSKLGLFVLQPLSWSLP